MMMTGGRRLVASAMCYSVSNYRLGLAFSSVGLDVF
jgi:hypothetical protein